VDEVGVLQKRSKNLMKELARTRAATEARKRTEQSLNPFLLKANERAAANPNLDTQDANFKVSLIIPQDEWALQSDQVQSSIVKDQQHQQQQRAMNRLMNHGKPQPQRSFSAWDNECMLDPAALDSTAANAYVPMETPVYSEPSSPDGCRQAWGSPNTAQQGFQMAMTKSLKNTLNSGSGCT
jgi:hypothetical protein